ncbi:N,N-dimethylformamidase beta subunit family domain-containing protein [Staphylospora marina]|uniref:N,N-dimethylformamidase beta subunit family domain-containing protein n=1 Tax=Staphylospora marina TaxID=2490858 RepID=UPI000F5BB67A|nr:N,N-dimethylformamidase beta subunit family domain-containing protein [Staphylospora marina]
MNRREFLKKASIFTIGAAGFALTGLNKLPLIHAISRKLHHTNTVTPVPHFDPKKARRWLLTLIFEGEVPERIQVYLLSKQEKILGTSSLMLLAAQQKIRKMGNGRFMVKLSVSPESVEPDFIHTRVWTSNLVRLLASSLEPDPDVPSPEYLPDIAGYPARISLAPGEMLELKVHTHQPVYHVEFIRHGAEEKVIHTVRNLPGMKQAVPPYAYRNGARWKTTLRFPIPKTWSTGLYSCRLTDGTGKEFYAPFILKSIDESIPRERRLAVLSSTNTWCAYNTWGGASLYGYRLNEEIRPKHAQMVSLDRPVIEATPMGEPNHLTNAEKLTLAWLETHNIPYTLICDSDLHEDPGILDQFGTLLINTHGEYWTPVMRNALLKFLDRGGNLMTLAGNSIYWKTIIQDHHVEVCKISTHHTLTGEPGGLWRDVGQPESSVLGVQYTTAGYMTFHPYEVKEPDHWVFAGTDLKKGSLFGEKGLNRWGPGASGLETDKMTSVTPKNAVLLAKGTNPDNGGADMIYYDHPGGGGVFSTGSVAYTSSLTVDPIVSQITRNVIRRFTGH